MDELMMWAIMAILAATAGLTGSIVERERMHEACEKVGKVLIYGKVYNCKSEN